MSIEKERRYLFLGGAVKVRVLGVLLGGDATGLDLGVHPCVGDL